jgi:DUF971 family protein
VEAGKHQRWFVATWSLALNQISFSYGVGKGFHDEWRYLRTLNVTHFDLYANYNQGAARKGVHGGDMSCDAHAATLACEPM